MKLEEIRVITGARFKKMGEKGGQKHENELRTPKKEEEKEGTSEGRRRKNRNRHAEKALPGGLIPMCCWPSMTKPPIGWPSGL